MKKRNFWSWLVNPFVRIAGWHAFFIGILFVILCAVVGTYANVAFDGVIDAHITTRFTFHTAFILQFINLLSLVGAMYIAAMIVAKHTRFVDILGTLTLARAPMLFLAIAGLFITPISAGEILQNPMAIFANTGYLMFMLTSVAAVVWMMTLFFNAWRVSTETKGTKLIVSFIIGMMAAEVVSKLLIYFFLQTHSSIDYL